MSESKKHSPEEIIRDTKYQILISNRGYIQAMQMAIDNLKDMNPKDRMEFAASLTMVIDAMRSSIKGWSKWCDPITLNGITLEQYQEIFPQMRDITKQWLEIDKKITEIKTQQLEDEMEKDKKTLFYSS